MSAITVLIRNLTELVEKRFADLDAKIDKLAGTGGIYKATDEPKDKDIWLKNRVGVWYRNPEMHDPKLWDGSRVLSIKKVDLSGFERVPVDWLGGDCHDFSGYTYHLLEINAANFDIYNRDKGKHVTRRVDEDGNVLDWCLGAGLNTGITVRNAETPVLILQISREKDNGAVFRK